MNIHVHPDEQRMGQAAATVGAVAIQDALSQRGEAGIIVATGASQFEVLGALIQASDIEWSRVTGFHLDEYIGLPRSHPASFRHYLKQRFVDHLPMKAFHYLNGEGDAIAECARVGALLAQQRIDVAFVGIGENGHLAFNDPPADFEIESPYLVVNLDQACRRQQFGEGWFPTLEAVPAQAISMSVHQILKSRLIVCSVPDTRKATAVQRTVEGAICPEVPASILQRHPAVELHLDEAAASQLKHLSNSQSSDER